MIGPFITRVLFEPRLYHSFLMVKLSVIFFAVHEVLNGFENLKIHENVNVVNLALYS